MKKVIINFKNINATLQTSQTTNVLERMIGLLNKKQLAENSGIWISPCKQVHTWFMKFSIDAVFVDNKNKVIAIEELKPWKLSKMHWKAAGVIETPFGWSKKNKLSVGSIFEVKL